MPLLAFILLEIVFYPISMIGGILFMAVSKCTASGLP
jgi:hypothetical protein